MKAYKGMTILEILMSMRFMSFLQLAKLTKIKPSRLHEIVENKKMTKRELKKISYALGVNLEDLERR